VREAGGEYVIADTTLSIDVAQPDDVYLLLDRTLDIHGRVDGLINNAAFNPKVEDGKGFSRFETMPLAEWHAALEVGLTGAFLCSQIIGGHMAANGGGVILNIASVLSVIAPDQRLYRQPDTPEDAQPVKPVTYSVEKAGLLGLTRYVATYWADKGVRCNALSPAGVYNGQPDEFVARLSDKIPMGRMARPDEYRAAVVFLLSDQSSYMTGANLVMDGGYSVW
jgi:NAD(P)-dependent dehydrogenase (short-subunit alcohol dehydrogenase family)